MEDGVVQIAVLADTHLSVDGENGRRFAAHFSRVRTAIAGSGAAFTLAAGDLAEHGSRDEFALFRDAAQDLPSPVLSVPGNHDVGGKGAAAEDLERRTAIYEAAVGPSFYCESVQGIRVIGMNASLLRSGLAIEAEQWSLLEAELKPSNNTILLTHYPLFLEDPEEPDDPYWNINSGPRARLLAMINESTVRAVLSGHIHRTLTRTWRGVPLITVPPVSFGLPPGVQPEGWGLVTVPTRGPVQVEIHTISSTDPAGQNGATP